MRSATFSIMAAGLLLLASAGFGQAQFHTRTVDATSSFFLRELGAIINLESDTLTFDMVMPAEDRPEKYREVDVSEGDRLLMCNGQRVTAIESLRELLDGLEPGTTVKLGLLREGSLRLASFERGDPDEMPGQMMVMTQDIGSDGQAEKTISFSGGGGGVDGTVMVLDGGLVIGAGADGPVVVALFPNASDKLTGELPQEGDRVVAINGELDTNIQAFQQLYDAIPEGEQITVEFEHEGARHSVSYVKSPLKAGRMMIKQ